MYSPPAAPPNHQITTNMNPTPTEIQAADSIAASLVLISWASRWNTRRSTSSRPTMRPSRTIHCQGWTVTSTKLPLRSAANTGVIVGALVPSVGSGPAHRGDQGPSSCSGESAGADYFVVLASPPTTAWAAARRAIGTRKGEQLT